MRKESIGWQENTESQKAREERISRKEGVEDCENTSESSHKMKTEKHLPEMDSVPLSDMECH